MSTVNKLLRRGAGLAPALVRRAPTVTLDWDLRQKSRFDCTDSQGRQVAVFLARGSVVRGGDVLVADDGSLLRAVAAPQPVLQVTHCPTHGTPFDLLRAAYHLGNRHVPLALQPDRLQLEPDPVLAEMLRSMHLIVTTADAPFEPESGAYASDGHGHTHDHHAAPHAPTPRPVAIPVRAAATPHVHGPACQHGHDDTPHGH